MKMPKSEPLRDLKRKAQRAEIALANAISHRRKQLIQAGAAFAIGTSMIAGVPNIASGTAIESEPNDSYTNSQYINFLIDSSLKGSLGHGGDIDFFTFTGLTPGSTFVAETHAPLPPVGEEEGEGEGSSIAPDTMLGWFSW